MKTFIDRFSELLTVRKDLGHSLKGKYVYLLTSSAHNHLPDGFEVPFRGLANYFGMFYKSSLHTWTRDGEIPGVLQDRMANFKHRIFHESHKKDESLARQNNRMVY